MKTLELRRMPRTRVARRVRVLRVRLRRWWDLRRAPWPVVGECHGHRGDPDTVQTCAQCADDHYHHWVAWPNAPSSIVAGPGVPVRCRYCGARKCDYDNCVRRRHDHTHPNEFTVAALS